MIRYFVFAVVLCLGCGAPYAEPEFVKMTELKLKPPTIKGEIVLSAKAIFNNPNAVGLNIDQMDLDVRIDDEKLAHISQDISAVMAARSDFALPIKVKLPAKKIFDQGKAGFFKQILNNRKVSVAMDGDIHVSKAGVRLKTPFESLDEYSF